MSLILINPENNRAYYEIIRQGNKRDFAALITEVKKENPTSVKHKISFSVKNIYTKCSKEFKFMLREQKSQNQSKVITMNKFTINWTGMLSAFKEF